MTKFKCFCADVQRAHICVCLRCLFCCSCLMSSSCNHFFIYLFFQNGGEHAFFFSLFLSLQQLNSPCDQPRDSSRDQVAMEEVFVVNQLTWPELARQCIVAYVGVLYYDR